MPTVDIIIPAYNAAKYLPAALDSVAAQDFEDWQVVLVDDGSTDNTADIVAPYRERFGPKMTYVRQENRGLPAARNAAIKASQSEFLALLDADDVWLPWRLSESVRALRDHPAAGLAYGGITLIDPDGKPGQSFLGDENNNTATRIATEIYTREIHLPCPTVTFRRLCVDQVGLFDESMRATEDRDMWLRIAQRWDAIFIRKVLAYYRVSPNAMSQNSDRMLTAQLQFIRKHFGTPGCGRIARRKALARAYKHRADGFKREGHRWNALLSSLRALTLFPFSTENVRTSSSLLVDWIGSQRDSA